MSGGSILALIGATLALLGPIALPFITVDEEEVGFRSFQILSGQLSLLLALASAAGAAMVLSKRKQSLGWVVAIASLGQVGLMAWTYQNVWNLVPCVSAGLSLCDTATGGLIDQTLVTLDWGMVLVVIGAMHSLVGGLWVVAAHPEYAKEQRFLKIALSWEGSTIYERTLFEPQNVTVGEADNNMFQIGARGLTQHVLLAPAGEGYRLDVPKGIGGQIQVGGELKDAAALNSAELKRGDSGVLTFENEVNLAFSFTGAETAVLAGSSERGGAAFAVSFSVSAGVVLMLLISALLTAQAANRKEVEENLEKKAKELIEVTLEEQQQQETEELEGEEEDTTAKKAANEEGKFGDAEQDPNKQSKVPKMDGKMVDKIDVKNLGIAKVLGGQAALTGALGTIMAGDTGALSSKMAVAMSGEGGELVIGHGSGGMGFRGTGSGGGGTGYGRIHGLGEIDTGGGTGRNANLGIGKKTGKKVAAVKIATGQSTGGCDKGDIAKNVKVRAAALRSCYEMQLMSKPSLQGKITAQWTIDTEGAVKNPKIVSDTMGSDAVSDCVVRTIGRIRFKKPDAGICVIQWPFVFSPG